MTALVRNIEKLEKAMLKEPQVACPVIHRFGPGVYIREVSIPAGSIAIGHHQNFEHTNVFLKGRVTMLKEDGSLEEIKAPMIFAGKPGRKIGVIHEDMVWLNVYATDEKDVEKLEAKLLTKSSTWNESVKIKSDCKLLTSLADRANYDAFRTEFSLSEEMIRRQSENESDMCELPFGGYSIKVAKSNIEGRGLFSTAEFKAGDLIAPARISGKRTIAGRFTNHSANPNAEMRRSGGSDIELFAVRSISGCHGGEDGEEITIDYRQALRLNIAIAQGGVKCQE